MASTNLEKNIEFIIKMFLEIRPEAKKEVIILLKRIALRLDLG